MKLRPYIRELFIYFTLLLLFQAYRNAHQVVLDVLKTKGINEITIQPEFPNDQSEQDPEDGLKTLIQTCNITCRESCCIRQRCCSFKEKLFEMDSQSI